MSSTEWADIQEALIYVFVPILQYMLALLFSCAFIAGIWAGIMEFTKDRND